jgi:hypothetical protein
MENTTCKNFLIFIFLHSLMWWLKVAELDHVKQIYHFGGTGIDGKVITVDVYAIQCGIMTQLQLAYCTVTVSFLEHGSEAYCFITSNCSEALYCCATVLQSWSLRVSVIILEKNA